MIFSRGARRFISPRRGCGCLGIPGSTPWLFFTLMYFFTTESAIPTGKWEFVWRFFAGSISLAVAGISQRHPLLAGRGVSAFRGWGYPFGRPGTARVSQWSLASYMVFKH